MNYQEIINQIEFQRKDAPEGKVFISDDGLKKWRVEVRFIGKDGKRKISKFKRREVTDDQIIKHLAKYGHVDQPDDIDSCSRCSGEGRIYGFQHVDDGVCFRCGGSGIDPKSRHYQSSNSIQS